MFDDEEKRLKKLNESINIAKQGLKKDIKKDNNKSLSSLYVGGIELVAGVGVGVFIGLRLDNWLETSPLCFFICFIFGTLGGGFNIYKNAKKM